MDCQGHEWTALLIEDANDQQPVSRRMICWPVAGARRNGRDHRFNTDAMRAAATIAHHRDRPCRWLVVKRLPFPRSDQHRRVVQTASAGGAAWSLSRKPRPIRVSARMSGASFSGSFGRQPEHFGGTALSPSERIAAARKILFRAIEALMVGARDVCTRPLIAANPGAVAGRKPAAGAGHGAARANNRGNADRTAHCPPGAGR